jgi:formate-dependent phosphoribosylglycinamide formyltransferase (GAR transformylase)
MLKQAKDRATLILVGSAELYRELAISALRLLPRR